LFCCQRFIGNAGFVRGFNDSRRRPLATDCHYRSDEQAEQNYHEPTNSRQNKYTVRHSIPIFTVDG
jgi:hypothetical protein